MRNKPWTKEEIKLLKENYPEGGVKQCLNVLNRTPGSINYKAQSLNLKVANPWNRWKKEELNLIKSLYSQDLNKLLKLLPGRSKDAIINQAAKLGVTRPSRMKSHKQYEQELFDIESELYPMSSYKGAFIPLEHECINGHSISITPSQVLHNKTSCPYCSLKDKETILYYIEFSFENNLFYKIGITTQSIEKRFSKETEIKITRVLLREIYKDGSKALNKEREILDKFKNEKIPHRILNYGGSSEVFCCDVLGLA